MPLTQLVDGFRDAVVVVIGGKGGIGREVVRMSADMGARVVAASASMTGDPTSLKAVAPGKVAECAVNLHDTTSIRALTEGVKVAFGRIDVLVNAAGITKQVPLKELDALTDDIIDLVMISNARAPLALIREMRPLLEAGRDPVFVQVSSVAACTGIGSSIAYVGAKAAMDAMMVSLAKVLAPRIRVVSVAPSALRTSFVTGRGEEFFQTTIKATPMERLATPAEVATAILSAARLLTATTGTVLYVDGGRHL